MATEARGEQGEVTDEQNHLAIRLVVGTVGFLALISATFLVGAFISGVVMGSVQTQAGVFAFLAGAIFVAPFAHVLFDRLITWAVES